MFVWDHLEHTFNVDTHINHDSKHEFEKLKALVRFEYEQGTV